MSQIPFPGGAADQDVFFHEDKVCVYHKAINTWECRTVERGIASGQPEAVTTRTVYTIPIPIDGDQKVLPSPRDLPDLRTQYDVNWYLTDQIVKKARPPIISASPPTNHPQYPTAELEEGDLWIDSLSELYYYKVDPDTQEGEWVKTRDLEDRDRPPIISDTEPAEHPRFPGQPLEEGDFWIDTNDYYNTPGLKYWTGSAWKLLADRDRPVIISKTKPQEHYKFPGEPLQFGDLWWDYHELWIYAGNMWNKAHNDGCVYGFPGGAVLKYDGLPFVDQRTFWAEDADKMALTNNSYESYESPQVGDLFTIVELDWTSVITEISEIDTDSAQYYLRYITFKDNLPDLIINGPNANYTFNICKPEVYVKKAGDTMTGPLRFDGDNVFIDGRNASNLSGRAGLEIRCDGESPLAITNSGSYQHTLDIYGYDGASANGRKLNASIRADGRFNTEGHVDSKSFVRGEELRSTKLTSGQDTNLQIFRGSGDAEERKMLVGTDSVNLDVNLKMVGPANYRDFIVQNGTIFRVDDEEIITFGGTGAFYRGTISTDDHMINKGYVDEKTDLLQNQIIELEEELEAIIPSLERGVWKMTLSGIISGPGLITFYDDTFGNGNPTGLFDAAKSIWFHETDNGNTPHGFSNVEPGNLLELFVQGEDEFGLYEVVEVHDQTHLANPYWVIDVNFVRTLENGSVVSNGDLLRLKTFEKPSGGDADAFVKKAGDDMSGSLTLKKDPFVSGDSPSLIFKARDNSNNDRTGYIKLDGPNNYLKTNSSLTIDGTVRAQYYKSHPTTQASDAHMRLASTGGFLNFGGTGERVAWKETGGHLRGESNRALVWDDTGITALRANNGSGSDGQVLTKSSSGLQWATPATGGGMYFGRKYVYNSARSGSPADGTFMVHSGFLLISEYDVDRNRIRHTAGDFTWQIPFYVFSTNSSHVLMASLLGTGSDYTGNGYMRIKTGGWNSNSLTDTAAYYTHLTGLW
jgi:hypothetical protein